MRDQTNWSVNLGRWGGVQVRLHIFFFFFAVLTLYLSIQDTGATRAESDWAVIASLVVLFVSVGWHELWHHRVATWLGGYMRECVLVPWGGMSSISVPRDYKSELLIYLAGPLANAAICLVCLPAVFAFEGMGFLNHLHPLQPQLGPGNESLLHTMFAITLWINWLLFIVNLIPAHPFDGGRILQAALTSVLGRQRAWLATNILAKVAAVALVIVACFIQNPSNEQMIKGWFALVMVAVLLFFSGLPEPEKPERKPDEDDLFGYDFSQGYTSLERSAESIEEDEASPIGQWLEQRRETRKQREVEIEADEEQRLDEVLARLHEGGIQSTLR